MMRLVLSTSNSEVMMLKKVMAILLLAAIIICSVSSISYVLENKESRSRYSSFFKEENDIDVLFIGSSHVRHGFFPMELWNDYGITAFNLAANGSTIPVSYWVLVNALDYKTPKVVVMDVYDLEPRVITSDSGQVHEQMDAFPLTKNKVLMINDLFDKKNLTEETINSDAYDLYDKKYTLIWPFSEYHTRWNDIGEYDFISKDELLKQSATWKGSSPLFGLATRQERKYDSDTSKYVFDDLSEKYLMKMIDLCNQKDISLVLINTGYDCNDTSKLFVDSVPELAQKKGLPYLDFTQMDIIDFSCDLFSTGENTHVNFSGAEKFTSYIGEYLNANYNLEDHRKDINFKKWDNDYGMFKESKIKYLKESTSLKEYLMYMADDDYQAIFEIVNPSILNDEKTKNQLANLGVKISEMGDLTNMIVIDIKNREADCLTYDINTVFNTVLGDIGAFSSSEWNSYGLYRDGNELKVQENEAGCSLRITVIDRSDGNIIDTHDF